ncbi:hypothetical protein SEA_HEATHER_32 [Streptomyces phage Heather]|uniref:Uncharacterized protein n=1 Tax=Streptomyces phage Heather TaxID=2562343 RepID=A0A4D6E5F5_9CAUD|nr:hypothetical protein SEA_HEATHER_32 [Streptomyces phage Heather]
MASVLIDKGSAPPLGDVRLLGSGDSIFLRKGWTERTDGARYADAVMSAVARGADVRWIRREAEGQ